jgi:hypothetical protein
VGDTKNSLDRWTVIDPKRNAAGSPFLIHKEVPVSQQGRVRIAIRCISAEFCRKVLDVFEGISDLVPDTLGNLEIVQVSLDMLRNVKNIGHSDTSFSTTASENEGGR